MNTLQSTKEQTDNKAGSALVVPNIIIPDKKTFDRLKIIPFITTFYDVMDEMLLD